MEEQTKIEHHEKNKRPKRKMKHVVVSLIIILLAVLFLTSVGLVAFMGMILVQNYHIDEAKLENMYQATTILDKNEQEVSTLFIENRQYVPIEEIPELVKEAFIAIEDHRFYGHQGIDPKAIARALYRDILARGMVEGGSTITQQLAKNIFLSHEKKLMRKTEEVLIAINLEKKYSKDEILEMYLNYIYFGHGAYGIQAASQLYFAKDVGQLELAEIALLAALPKAPNHYTPFWEENKERSEERRKLVLSVMEAQGKITAEQGERTVNTSLTLNPAAFESKADNPSVWTYIDMVLAEAEDRYGLNTEELLTGGYRIHTALDPKMQEIMYNAFRLDSEMVNELFPASGPKQHVQASMVILDHQTGAVLAVMGGRDYVRRGLNRALKENRQPGSVFKPIVAYAPALELGWQPNSQLQDELISYAGYQPKNYDHVYRGKVHMVEAIEKSHNAPAVWLLNEIGIENGVRYAHSFGFPQVKSELGLGIALGGGEFGVSPLGMASAYGSFANKGILMQPYLIERMEDKNGNIVAESKPLQQNQVISKQTAWYMTQMLEKVVQEGTGTRAQLTHAIAGKTGTTQTIQGEKGVRDAWFVGYTPQYSAAVWMGFDQADPNHVMDTSGGNHAAKLFQHVMQVALADSPAQTFVKPEGVEDLPALKTEKKEKDKKKKDEEKEKKKKEKEEEKKKREEEKQQKKKEKEKEKKKKKDKEKD